MLTLIGFVLSVLVLLVFFGMASNLSKLVKLASEINEKLGSIVSEKGE